MDLIVRRLTQPGDTVFVDDPGYSNLLSALRLRGLRLVGVPMTPTGPDPAALETLLEQHRPQLYLTNTQLQNPTGASYSAATAFKVLRLAERYDFTGGGGQRLRRPGAGPGLHPGRRRPAAGAWSTWAASPSPSRPGCGWASWRPSPGCWRSWSTTSWCPACPRRSSTSASCTAISLEGHVRKHLEQLRNRLAKAQERTCRRLENARFKLFLEPGAGMFVWARPADASVDTLALAKAALPRDILLAPGHLFRSDQAPSPWLRFNVAHCDNDRLFAFLDEALGGARRPVR